MDQGEKKEWKKPEIEDIEVKESEGGSKSDLDKEYTSTGS